MSYLSKLRATEYFIRLFKPVIGIFLMSYNYLSKAKNIDKTVVSFISIISKKLPLLPISTNTLSPDIMLVSKNTDGIRILNTTTSKFSTFINTQESNIDKVFTKFFEFNSINNS